MMTKTKYGIMLMLLSATGLLTGCSNDDYNENSNGNANANENAISFSTNLQPFAKASTYSSVTDMQTEGSFTCTTYEANSTTVSIPASRVVWSGIDWQFADDIYFWPISGDLDFFAYMPKGDNLPSYVSSVSYSTARIPQFACSGMPLTGQDGLKEFIWALSTGKNKSNSSDGVEMAFKHVFARVKFVVGNPASDKVTINSVTIPGIYSSGTCTWPNTWSSLGGADSFVAGGDESWYLVIPNNYGSKTLTVNATWKNWSEVSQSKSKDITVNWAAGHSYTYTIKLDENGLIIDTEKYTEQW